MNYTGVFISLEGGEGSGKTTNLSFIKEYLNRKHVPTVITREPGGTHLGEQLRNILLTPSQQEPICADAELLMIFAARAQHMKEVIYPALARGEWVVSDRFIDSSYAYQGVARGIKEDRIDQLVHWTLDSFSPQLTLYLDCSPEQGLKRAGECGKPDRFEQEQLSFFLNVRTGFLQRASKFPSRFKVIDANQSLDNVQAEISKILDQLISRHNARK